MFDFLLMLVLGICCGFMVSGGVFTALLVLGLVPRFADKTRTAYKILTYESAAVYGCIIGGCLSVFQVEKVIASSNLLAGIREILVQSGVSMALIVVGGFMGGCFVGCLALAIAELLDSIPIFSRRIGFPGGLGIIVLTMAVGKSVGSFIYFAFKIYETVG